MKYSTKGCCLLTSNSGYLASVKTWINTFSTSLSTDESMAGINFRFGFRVFRDKGHDRLFDSCTDGICEGIPLNKVQCAPPAVAQGNDEKLKEWSQASLRQLQEALETVKAAPNGEKQQVDRDFEEQLGAALNTVLEKDIRGCDERIKLVFVIGDHGDTTARFEEADIPTALRGHHRRLELFFLQTANSSSTDEAQAAYQRFQAQAHNTVDTLLDLRKEDKLPGGQAADYLHTLDNADKMREAVQQRVGSYASKRSLEELRNDLLKGTDKSKPLLDAVRATGRYPVFYLQLGQETLGEGFDRETLHDVAQFEVPDDDNLVERFVWRSKVQLNALTRDLEDFRDLESNFQGDPLKQREKLIQLLDEQIKRITGDEYDRTKTLQALMEEYTTGKAGQIQKALPFGTASPLLQYSMQELEDSNIVRNDCELPALIRRIVTASEALVRLSQEPTDKIRYQLQAAMPDTCGSPKNDKAAIQALKLNATSDTEPLAPPSLNEKPVDRKAYSYCHATYGAGEICWIPFALLP